MLIPLMGVEHDSGGWVGRVCFLEFWDDPVDPIKLNVLFEEGTNTFSSSDPPFPLFFSIHKGLAEAFKLVSVTKEGPHIEAAGGSPSKGF